MDAAGRTARKDPCRNRHLLPVRQEPPSRNGADPAHPRQDRPAHDLQPDGVPLSNPARVNKSADRHCPPPPTCRYYAGAMARLGTGRSLDCLGANEGLDELSLAGGGTKVAVVTGNAFKNGERVDAPRGGPAPCPDRGRSAAMMRGTTQPAQGAVDGRARSLSRCGIVQRGGRPCWSRAAEATGTKRAAMAAEAPRFRAGMAAARTMDCPAGPLIRQRSETGMKQARGNLQPSKREIVTARKRAISEAQLAAAARVKTPPRGFEGRAAHPRRERLLCADCRNQEGEPLQRPDPRRISAPRRTCCRL